MDLLNPEKHKEIEFVQIPDQYGMMHIVSRHKLSEQMRQF